MNPTSVSRAHASASRLDHVAECLATEFELLALAADALQEQIGLWVEAESIKIDSEAIMRLQETDRMSQTLRSLARLIARLAPELNGIEMHRDTLAAEIGLESVARRILDN